MVKKILFFLLITYSFLFAEIARKADIDSLLNKTNAIALGHNALIEDRSTISTSTISLKALGYLDSNFLDDNLFGGNITYTASSTAIDMNTNVLSSSLTVEEKDYFLNHYSNAILGRNIYEKSGFIYVMYFYSKNAISNVLNNNIQNTYIGESVPASYATVSANQTWWDANDVSFNVKKYVNTSWVNEDYNNQKINPDGTFLNLDSIPLAKTNWNFTQVTSAEQILPTISCRGGSTYNQTNNRCEAFTSDACEGNYFDTTTGICYKKTIDYCNSIGYSGYDNVNNRCSRGSIIYTNKVPYTYYISPIIQNILVYDETKWTFTSVNFSYDMLQINWYFHVTGDDEYFQFWVSAYGSQIYYTSYPESSGASFFYGFVYGAYTVYFQKPTYGDARAWIYKQTPICTSGYYSGGVCVVTNWGCPAGYWDNGGNCATSTIEYSALPSSFGANYNFNNNAIGGADAYVKTPTCAGKYMTASGYTTIATPSYGNNGICYSEVGLYCATYSGSTNKILLPDGKQILCWDTTQSCNNNDTSFELVYNYSGVADKCRKFNYSCGATKRIYGLNQTPSNNDTLDLFNRIASKDTKATTNVANLLAGNNVIVNDNAGSMCVDMATSTFTQSITSPNYTINSIQKSGF